MDLPQRAAIPSAARSVSCERHRVKRQACESRAIDDDLDLHLVLADIGQQVAYRCERRAPALGVVSFICMTRTGAHRRPTECSISARSRPAPLQDLPCITPPDAQSRCDRRLPALCRSGLASNITMPAVWQPRAAAPRVVWHTRRAIPGPVESADTP